MSDELIQRLKRVGVKVPIPCPDGIEGCLVYHYRIETDPACLDAIDRIEQLQRELAEAREALAGVMPYLETMLIDDEPDDATVGWEWDYEAENHSKPIELTMGQIRRARAALAKMEINK